MKLAQKYALAEERMRGIEPIPSDFPKYIEDNIKHHLFYSRKDGMCYCSKCKEVVPYQPLRHNDLAICPKCGTQAIAKSIGMSRKKKEINWFTLVQHFEDGLIVRHFRTLVDWQDYKSPILETEEEWRNVITPSKFDSYMWWWRYGESVKAWIPEKKRGMGCYAYEGEMYHPYTAKCYTDLGEVIKGTGFQYSCLPELLELFEKVKPNGDIDCYGIEYTLNSYRAFPQIEMLYKVGFYNLLSSINRNEWHLISNTLTYSVGRATLCGGNDICTVLGITHAQYKLILKKGGPTPEELAVLQVDKSIANDDDFKFATIMYKFDHSPKFVKDLVARRPLKKFAAYFKKHNINLDEYRDHLRWLSEGDYPDEDYYLFPRDFQSAHERLANEVIESQKAEANKERALQTIAMKRLAEEKSKINAFTMHYNGMFLMIADSPGALIMEGKILHHCVGGYVDRVARGETTILFVRKEASPDTPFYTMEYRNGRVRQLYGRHDCVATPEVQAFSDEFLRRVTDELRVERAAA